MTAHLPAASAVTGLGGEASAADAGENPHRGRLLEALQERRDRMMREGHIHNSDLYAGSDMFYYCKYCGVLSDQLPETWAFTTPRRICEDCQTLIEFSWHDGERPLFPRRSVGASVRPYSG